MSDLRPNSQKAKFDAVEFWMSIGNAIGNMTAADRILPKDLEALAAAAVEASKSSGPAERAPRENRSLAEYLHALAKDLDEESLGVSAAKCREAADALSAQPEAGADVVKDAARYRWLRDHHNDGDEQWFVYGAKSDDLDAEVDEKLRQLPSQLRSQLPKAWQG